MQIRTGVAGLMVFLAGCFLPASSQSSPRGPSTHPLSAEHEDAMRRAQVWMEPDISIETAGLAENPGGPGAFGRRDVVTCRFQPGVIAGNTPKFHCELDSGETVKVKYGRTNPEVYAEVSATRLLGILGFPTDRMYVVERVRCFGCPEDPFEDLQCMNEEDASLARCFPDVDYSRAQDFDPAVIERPVKGRRIEAPKARGWSWEELEKIDASAGGANRAQIDAFRLLAVFLGHWDNKAENQRLLCLGEKHKSTTCEHPLAMVQDLGATFGPDKLNLDAWAKTPIWADVATCRVSMQALPYGGSTFPDRLISEEGRQFLAARLGRLSTQQVRDLFDGARIAQYPHKVAGGQDVENWVRAFEDKVHAIADRAPCPPAP
jgi:hypothetical protein